MACSGSSAEFASKRLTQSVDDLIRIDTAAGAGHVDQWVAIDQRTSKGAKVRNSLFPGQHGNPEIDEAGVAQRVLNRVDFVVARPDPRIAADRSGKIGLRLRRRRGRGPGCSRRPRR